MPMLLVLLCMCWKDCDPENFSANPRLLILITYVKVMYIYCSSILSFRNIMFNIFSIYNLIMSIANLTSMPNDSSINPITILYT